MTTFFPKKHTTNFGSVGNDDDIGFAFVHNFIVVNSFVLVIISRTSKNSEKPTNEKMVNEFLDKIV